MIDIRLISLIVCGSVFGDNQLIRSGITRGSRDHSAPTTMIRNGKYRKYKVQIQNSNYEYKNTNTKIQSINKIRDYGGSNAPSMLSTDSREIK